MANVTLPRVFFKHFASKKQLPGLSIKGTLVKNRLKILKNTYLVKLQGYKFIFIIDPDEE